MRHLINLFENAAPFVIDDRFVAAVQRYLETHLADWADDFPDLKSALEKMWAHIDEHGAPDGGAIEVYREELRPTSQIASKDYGTLGACWSWDFDGAATCNHDNAYDEHGRENVQPVIFVASVALHDVDWVQTMAKNLVLKNEREISIKSGATVHVEGQMAPGKQSYPYGEGFNIGITDMSDGF